MAAFFSTLSRLFGAKAGTPAYNTAEVYEGLRHQILQLTPEQLGAPAHQPVLAVLMETGYPGAVVTLVAVMDGAASLYFSNGGGIIGAGEKAEPNAVARKLVANAAAFASECQPATEFPLPALGYTRFYIVRPKGVLTGEAKEADLSNGRHRLSPLFQRAHELITQIRITGEQRAAEHSGASNAAPPCP